MTRPTPAPKHLSQSSRKLWTSIIDRFEVDDTAKPILQTFLESLDRRTQAREAIAAEGAYVKDRFGQVKAHPALAVERDAAGVAVRSWRALGFGQEPPAEPAEDDE